MKTPDDDAPAPVLQLAEWVSGWRTTMLTTRDHEDALRSRPMTPLALDAAGNFWFFCDQRHSDLATVVRRAPQVSLAFSDEGSSTFVSIRGTAVIEHDRDHIRALWSPLAKPWFPDGPESPDLVLLRVHCDVAETWDAPDSVIVRSLALAASVIAGRPVGLGEHDTIVPTPLPAT
ncbi:MAG: pyridoxamine 5'-phosphate oxidase family protein [Rubrivivax sp.]